MTDTNLTIAHLEYPKDWPKWLLQLQFQADRQDIWEYINPEAADAEDPMRRIPRPPTIDETIAKRQNELQEQYARDLQAADGEPGSQPRAPARVTERDVREEYAARLTEYNMAVAEREEVRKGYRIVCNWVYSTVEAFLLSAAQETATAAGDSSLQGVVRALQDRLSASTNSSVLVSSFGMNDFKNLSLVTRGGGLLTTKGTTSSFLKLPNEILLSITQRLELHENFVLGQTCKALRNVVQRDWKLIFNRLPSVEKHDFLTRLAFVLPDHWVCGFCDKLHHIDKNDLPWREPYNRCPYDEPGARFDFRWLEIRERHVQLALKFTRLRTNNQDYLGKIMSQFTDGFTLPKESRNFQASPKIVTERFLLHIRQEVVHSNGLSFAQLEGKRICPHMGVCSSGRYYGPQNFCNDVKLAFEQPGNEIAGHCPRCPLDYSILTSPSRIIMQAWYDFGSYKSPKDKSWTVHVRSHQNVFSTGPTVYHDPGSIRRLYVTGSGSSTI